MFAHFCWKKIMKSLPKIFLKLLLLSLSVDNGPSSQVVVALHEAQ